MREQLKKTLVDLFEASVAGSKGINAIQYRAKSHDKLDLLDELESKHYVDIRDKKYYVCLPALLELESESKEATSLLLRCEVIFQFLRNFYIENPEHQIFVDDLAKRVDMPKGDVLKSLGYMVQSSIFGSYTTALAEADDAWVQPSESIIRSKAFKDTIYRITEPSEYPVGGLIWTDSIVENIRKEEISESAATISYIDESRIKDLESIKSEDFDFSRLIKICREINSACENGNYFSIGALLRVILDHVPPSLGFSTFGEVSASYPGKSLKEVFNHLEKGCRKISDGLLHQSIRKRESLPNFNQVNYISQIDALLAEIVRKNGE